MRKDRPGVSRRTVVGGLVGAGAAMFTSKSATAQAAEWPNRPVTFVVPFGPGASNDTFTRMLCNILSKKMNQPFVVENRAGAGGFTGAYAVSTAAPDGYRFLETPQSIASFKPIMKVALDPVTELQAVACLAKSPYAVHITATIPVKSIPEMIEYAKKNPDTTFYGGTGTGSAGHLYTELFNKVTGTKMKKVDYKSSADVQNDLIAGRVHLYFVTVASTLGQIKAGQLRLIAYTNNSAPADAPKAPLLKDVGVPGFDEIGSWWGIFAPKGINPGILEKANKVINEAILEPEFVTLFTNSSATAAPMSPNDFHKVLTTEVALTEKIIKDAGIKIE